MLENDIRRLSTSGNTRTSASTTALYSGGGGGSTLPRQFPTIISFASSHPHPGGTLSTTSLNNSENDPPAFLRQRPASVDPVMRMEEMRRNIAERRHQRSYSRPRMPPSLPTTAPPQGPDPRSNDETHNRASSGPSSVVYSTGLKSPGLDSLKSQNEMERQLAEYVASLPAATRRRFVAATGLNEKDFANYPIQHSVTPSLPEGAKLSLMRQGSRGSNASSSSRKQQPRTTPPNEESPPFAESGSSSHGVRIHLTEPSTDAKLQALNDPEELNSQPSTDEEEGESEPDEPQTPASGVSASSYRHQPNHIYQYEIQPPQTHTQIHTTTVVEVNKEQLSTPHRSHLRSKNGQQKMLIHQSNSLGADPTTGGHGGGGHHPRLSESPK